MKYTLNLEPTDRWFFLKAMIMLYYARFQRVDVHAYESTKLKGFACRVKKGKTYQVEEVK